MAVEEAEILTTSTFVSNIPYSSSTLCFGYATVMICVDAYRNQRLCFCLFIYSFLEGYLLELAFMPSLKNGRAQATVWF